jgi:hypothetical protein
LDSWITPNDEFFAIKHFDEPELTSATGAWRSAAWSSGR